MSRKIRIASVPALAGVLLISVPAAALAGSPLLSGYGGPGAGEQAIIGSTFVKGPSGGTGSGGSTGSPSSTGANGEGSPGSGAAKGSPGASGSGQTHTGASGSGLGSTSSQTPTGKTNSPSKTGRSDGTAAKRAGAYVYPGSLASASSDSPVIGISSGDVLLLVGIIAMLALIGVLTVRLARLQP